MKEMNINKELPVLVIPGTVYLPETDMNLKIDKKQGRKSITELPKTIFMV